MQEVDRMDKEIHIYEPAYIHMDLWKEKDGFHGAISIDDKMGWAWYGDDDAFLLGLLRIGDSRGGLWTEFEKAIEEEGIKKEEIKGAILTSLKLDKTDGLWHIIGDNATYLGFDVYDEWEDINYTMSKCLKERGINPDLAEKITNDLIFEGTLEQRSTRDVFDELENELADDTYELTGKHKSWRKVVEKAVEECDERYEDAVGFLNCVVDELLPYKEEGTMLFYERYDSEVYGAWKKATSNKEVIREIAEKHGVNTGDIEACLSEM